jgi:hypothetical protein
LPAEYPPIDEGKLGLGPDCLGVAYFVAQWMVDPLCRLWRPGQLDVRDVVRRASAPPLANLSPRIEAIAEGRTPGYLTPTRLARNLPTGSCYFISSADSTSGFRWKNRPHLAARTDLAADRELRRAEVVSCAAFGPYGRTQISRRA